jgi:hypothetical protein
MGEFDSYIRAWRSRWAAEASEDAAAARHAKKVARRLAGLLARRYGARRVILCGSLARGAFRRGSDIDLAVEGVADDRFFEAGAAAANAAKDIEVDLVPLESATPAYRRHVAEEGVVLYEATRS